MRVAGPIGHFLPTAACAALRKRAMVQPMMTKILAAVFMTVVIATECFLASAYLSAANESLAQAQATVKDEEKLVKEAGEEKEGEGEDGERRVEVDLQQFDTTITQPGASTSLHVSFHLYGTVAHKEEGEFTSVLESSKHRFRNEVITIIRSSELKDLSDPGLGLIKRKILTTTNRTFGKNLLKEIIFSDFNFYEQ